VQKIPGCNIYRRYGKHENPTGPTASIQRHHHVPSCQFQDTQASRCSAYFNVNIRIGKGTPLSTYLQHLHRRPPRNLAQQPLDTKIPCTSSSNLPESIASVTYADDVAAESLTMFGLQSLISLISHWMKQNQCWPNVDRIQIMIFNSDKAVSSMFSSFAL
jgi:hypothetical protein